MFSFASWGEAPAGEGDDRGMEVGGVSLSPSESESEPGRG